MSHQRGSETTLEMMDISTDFAYQQLHSICTTFFYLVSLHVLHMHFHFIYGLIFDHYAFFIRTTFAADFNFDRILYFLYSLSIQNSKSATNLERYIMYMYICNCSEFFV